MTFQPSKSRPFNPATMMPGLRRALFSALLVLLAPLARAEDLKPLPAGTESLISSGDLASFVISGAGGPSTYSHRMLDSDSETPNGAREVTALTGSGQPWSIELKYPIATAIAEGDILLLRYRLRTVAVNVETGEGEVSAYVQRNRPEWEKIHTSIDTAGSSWKLLAYAFVADRAFGPGESEVGFGFDLLRQTVQLADAELLRLPPGTPLEVCPFTASTTKVAPPMPPGAPKPTPASTICARATSASKSLTATAGPSPASPSPSNSFAMPSVSAPLWFPNAWLTKIPIASSTAGLS